MARFGDVLRGKTPAAKARRKARQARWRAPLRTNADRRAAWWDLLAVDHGVFRLVYRNRHRVSADLWRSAQPSPHDVAWAAKAGIRSIVSLRGDGFGGDVLEQEACSRHGLSFHRQVLYSRSAPSLTTLREAIALFPTLERPVLVHCKSGADRAGLAVALWLLVVEQRPAVEAAAALSWRYGHVRAAKTGILDAFIMAYAVQGERQGLSFSEWVDTVYDPKALTAAFKTNRAGDALLALLDRE